MTTITESLFGPSNRRRCVKGRASYVESVDCFITNDDSKYIDLSADNCKDYIHNENGECGVLDDIDDEPVTIDLSDFLKENPLLTESTAENAADSNAHLSDCHSQFRVTNSLMDETSVAEDFFASKKSCSEETTKPLCDISIPSSDIDNSNFVPNNISSSLPEITSSDSNSACVQSENNENIFKTKDSNLVNRIKSPKKYSKPKSPLGFSNPLKKYKNFSKIKDFAKNNIKVFGKYPIVKCEKLDIENFIKKNDIKISNWPLSTKICSPNKKLKLKAKIPKAFKPISFNKSVTNNKTSGVLLNSLKPKLMTSENLTLAKNIPIFVNKFAENSSLPALSAPSVINQKVVHNERIIRIVTSNASHQPSINNLSIQNCNLPYLANINKISDNCRTYKLISPKQNNTPLISKIIATPSSPIYQKPTFESASPTKLNFIVSEPYVKTYISPVNQEQVPLELSHSFSSPKNIIENSISKVKSPVKLFTSSSSKSPNPKSTAKLSKELLHKSPLKSNPIILSPSNDHTNKSIETSPCGDSETSSPSASSIIVDVMAKASKIPPKKSPRSKHFNKEKDDLFKDKTQVQCQTYNSTLNDILFGFGTNDFADDISFNDDIENDFDEQTGSITYDLDYNKSNNSENVQTNKVISEYKYKRKEKDLLDGKLSEHEKVSPTNTENIEKLVNDSHSQIKIDKKSESTKKHVDNLHFRDDMNSKPENNQTDVNDSSFIETKEVLKKAKNLRKSPKKLTATTPISVNSDKDEQKLISASKRNSCSKSLSKDLDPDLNSFNSKDKIVKKNEITTESRTKRNVSKNISIKTPVAKVKSIMKAKRNLFTVTKKKSNRPADIIQEIKTITGGKKSKKKNESMLKQKDSELNGASVIKKNVCNLENKKNIKGKRKKSKTLKVLFKKPGPDKNTCINNHLSASDVKLPICENLENNQSLHSTFREGDIEKMGTPNEDDELETNTEAPSLEEKLVDSNTEAPLLEKKLDEPKSEAFHLEEKLIESNTDALLEKKLNEPPSNTETLLVEEKLIEKTSLLKENLIEKSSLLEENLIEKTSLLEEKLVEKTSLLEEKLIEEAPLLEEKLVEETPLFEKLIESNTEVSPLVENLVNSKPEKLHGDKDSTMEPFQSISTEDSDINLKKHENDSLIKNDIFSEDPSNSVGNESAISTVSQKKETTNDSITNVLNVENNEIGGENVSKEIFEALESLCDEAVDILEPYLSNPVCDNMGNEINFEFNVNEILQPDEDNSNNIITDSKKANETVVDMKSACDDSHTEVIQKTNDNASSESNLSKTTSIQKTIDESENLSHGSTSEYEKTEISDETSNKPCKNIPSLGQIDSLKEDSEINKCKINVEMNEQDTDLPPDLVCYNSDGQNDIIGQDTDLPPDLLSDNSKDQDNIVQNLTDYSDLIDKNKSDYTISHNTQLIDSSRISSDVQQQEADSTIQNNVAETESKVKTRPQRKKSCPKVKLSKISSEKRWVSERKSSTDSNSDSAAKGSRKRNSKRFSASGKEKAIESSDITTSTDCVKSSSLDTSHKKIALIEKCTREAGKNSNADFTAQSENLSVPPVVIKEEPMDIEEMTDSEYTSDFFNVKVEPESTESGSVKVSKRRKSSKLPELDSVNVAVKTEKEEKGKTSFTPKNRPKTFSLEAVQLPLKSGWIRELVHRANEGKGGKRQSDVYYFTPEGKKLRSMPEILSYLSKNNITDLNGQNFTFSKNLVYRTPFEIERDAKVKASVTPTASRKKPDSTTPISTPSSSSKKSTSKKLTETVTPRKRSKSEILTQSKSANKTDTKVSKHLKVQSLNKSLPVRKKQKSYVDFITVAKIEPALPDNLQATDTIDTKKMCNKKSKTGQNSITSVSSGNSTKQTKPPPKKRRHSSIGLSNIETELESTPLKQKKIKVDKSETKSDFKPQYSADDDLVVYSSSDEQTPLTVKKPLKVKFSFHRQLENSGIVRDPCTFRCKVAGIQEAKIRCAFCLCLFHQCCIPMYPDGLNFVCKPCAAFKLAYYAKLSKASSSATESALSSATESALSSSTESSWSDDPETYDLPNDIDIALLMPNLRLQTFSKRTVSCDSVLPEAAASSSNHINMANMSIASSLLLPEAATSSLNNITKPNMSITSPLPSTSQTASTSVLPNLPVSRCSNIQSSPFPNLIYRPGNVSNMCLPVGTRLSLNTPRFNIYPNPIILRRHPNTNMVFQKDFPSITTATPQQQMLSVVSTGIPQMPIFTTSQARPYLQNTRPQRCTQKTLSNQTVCSTITQPRPTLGHANQNNVLIDSTIQKPFTIPSATQRPVNNHDTNTQKTQSQLSLFPASNILKTYLRPENKKSSEILKHLAQPPLPTNSVLQISVINTETCKINTQVLNPIQAPKNHITYLKTENRNPLNNSQILIKLPAAEKVNEASSLKQEISFTTPPLGCDVNKILQSYECLKLVLRKLNVYGFLKASQVCTTWKKFASEEHLWKTVVLQDLRVTDWRKCCTSLQKHRTKTLDLCNIILKDSEDPWKELKAVLNKLTGIRELMFNKATPTLLASIAKNMPQLLKLECFLISIFTEPEMWSTPCELELAPLQNLSKLRTLKIGSVGGIVLKEEPACSMPYLPYLMHLSLTGFKFHSATNLNSLTKYKNLVTLELGDCSSAEPEIYDVLKQLTNLKNLRLENGGNHEDTKLCEALMKMQKLEQLELMNYEIPSSLSNSLKNLMELIRLIVWPNTIKQGSLSNYNLYQAISSCKRLKYICWGIIAEGSSLPDMFEMFDFQDNQTITMSFEELFKKLVSLFSDCRVELKCVPKSTWREFCSSRK